MEGNGTAAPFHYPFQRWQHRWPLPWVRVHQTIIIKHDEIIPFTVSIILCRHYCSSLTVNECYREWLDGVIQCNVSMSLSHCRCLRWQINIMSSTSSFLASIPRLLFCSDTSFNLGSKNNVHMFTNVRPHADCKNNATFYLGFWGIDARVNCICFLCQDTML